MYSRLFFAFIASTFIKHHVCNARIIEEDFSLNTGASTLEKLHESRFGFDTDGTLTWNLSCVSQCRCGQVTSAKLTTHGRVLRNVCGVNQDWL